MKEILVLFTVAILSSCASSTYKFSQSCPDGENNNRCLENRDARSVAIFFDGTSNTPSDNTNVFKMYEIINSTTEKNVMSMYVEGVGTEWYRIVSGNLFGNGLDSRLEESYEYLLKNYREGEDELYLFGFSRGAHNARMLAGLLFIAGLPNTSHLNDSERKQLVEDIVDIYRDDDSFKLKKERIFSLKNFQSSQSSASIKFMGIWDTVSATEMKLNNEVFLEKPSNNHIDQVCNINKVAHAVSIDDNRGKRFTPELMILPSLAKHCGLAHNLNSSEVGDFLNEKIDEVWFSGAHSDVGGAYAQPQPLGGVSMNWMLRKLSQIDDSILTRDYIVDEDANAASHIGEDSIIGGKLYLNWNRNIPEYMKLAHPQLSTFTMHSSALARVKETPRTFREFALIPDEMSETINFKDCFERVELMDGELKNDPRKADYTLKYSPKDGAKCFYVDEPNLYDYL
ncbi:T6SS phospholipase effector Tle1-like catalytic domain-containing protein [Shewanella sp. 10N.286.48.A6]|uniref:phospholipase effector Tle1 domain-containing protein n=1 Tax=Shewanella sp. 10N.286.48.A6 TaxID=1880833 RepID=UPI000C855A4F|nr:DUF2235 domain-containing protein [Shewanella sp. 10N.286.48.A6]PMH96294.1 hypothetical protein BCU55_19405 [Shewanella sp. 10N.286.48.A6]